MTRSVGWTTHEFGTGTHRFLGDHGPAGAQPIRLDLDLHIESLGVFANPLAAPAVAGVMACEGTITVGGLVRDAPCSGTLEMRAVSERLLRYALSFEDADGARYRFLGEKPDLRLRTLHRTLFTCHGAVFDADGREISRSTVFFYRGTPTFLLRQRLTWAERRSA